MGRGTPNFFERLGTLLEPIMAQSAAAGALATLYAATSPDAEGGVLYGPDGVFELKGAPKKAKIVKAGFDQAVWRELWYVSERLTRTAMPHLQAA